MSRTIRNLINANWHRNPKTQAEKRLVAQSLEQGVKVRPKRNARHLPDSYDDLRVAARSEKVEVKKFDAPGLF